MKWIEITGVQLTPNPVSCNGFVLVDVSVIEFEKILTVSDVNALTVAEMNATRVDLFAFD